MLSDIIMMKTQMMNWIPIFWEFLKKALDFQMMHTVILAQKTLVNGCLKYQVIPNSE